MSVDYRLTARARGDVLGIWNWIAADNVAAADAVARELELAMRKLASMPQVGHRRPDVKNPRYRFWKVYAYLIAYFPDTQPIQIIRVVHGARDFTRIFRK